MTRHEDFAKRLSLACENNPNVPPLNHGRLGWFVEQFDKRFDVQLTGETIRKWFSGQSRPHPHSKMEQLAQIIRSDVAWLATGSANTPTRKQSRIRSEMADGSVNLLAGLIQMSGSYPALPSPDDAFAKENFVDLYAIIRGTQHAFHIAVAEAGTVTFPLEARNVILLALVATSGISFEIVQIDRDKLDTVGVVKGDTICAPVEDVTLRRISTFAEKF